MSDSPIRRTRAHLEYQNEYVVVYNDDVTMPDGEPSTYLRIESPMPGLGVVVLALMDDRIGLVHTYRYPIAQWQWALPRGFAQSDDVLETARGELREELGVVTSKLTAIGHVTPDSGMLAARVAVVLAGVDGPLESHTDTQEVHAIDWVSPALLDERIAAGSIEDGFTLAALALARASGKLPGPHQ
jgi:8-oxo-dGTP pyrophosphatase MutT (NUDIX family)